MALIFFVFLLLLNIYAGPELLNLSSQNQCIKAIVETFVNDNTCQRLSQDAKSELALKMTNCLFTQMGKPTNVCASLKDCDLAGDSWNTFTIFFAHIDNLCHFYWELSKATRTENMIDALVSSAQKTERTLSKNNQNTLQILEMQNSLKIQMLSAIASQQQMSQIINNSSIVINTLTSEISSSLARIHDQMNQNYQVVTRILSTVNQVLKHLDSLSMFLFAEISSIQGVLFFVALVFLVIIGSVVSQRVRYRRNQCFILVCGHFLLEFFLSSVINYVVGVQTMRCFVIILIFTLLATAKSPNQELQKNFSIHLSSERMNRLMQRAIRNQISQLQLKRIKMKNEKGILVSE